MASKKNPKVISPMNDAERVEFLRSLNILDTPKEKVFDDLVEEAAKITGFPISALTLIDESRQWIKAGVGLSISETDREIAFCSHTIMNKPGSPFIVENAPEDPIFEDNPFVTAQGGIGYYAGFPLVMSGGFAVGSFCVADRRPNSLTASQLSALRALAVKAVERLEAMRLEPLRNLSADRKSA